jgi:2-isopropylmalate synthase
MDPERTDVTNNRVTIFDTTLRDGEQAVGAAMAMEDKLTIAIQLERLGVDIIEAGFPIASALDYGAVVRVSKEIKASEVCAFARMARRDIDIAAEALQFARSPRIEIVTPTSDLHIEHRLRMNREQVLDAIAESVGYARNKCAAVHWIAEDCSRSDSSFMIRAFDTAIRAGASTVAVADTVGYATPAEIHERIRLLHGQVSGIENVTISIHCHDDLGLATANSLAALAAGAREIQCTVNGIGERAGNASLEEIVMCIHSRRDVLPFQTRIDTTEIVPTSELIERSTGFLVPPNKAIVGKNAFAHGSGMHQAGVVRAPETYEFIEPTSVGRGGRELPITRHSGRAGVRQRLQELGESVSTEQAARILDMAKDRLGTTDQLSNDELRELKRLADS